MRSATDELLDRVGAAFGLIATADCTNVSFNRVQWLNRLGSVQDRIAEEYEGEMQPADPAFAHVNHKPGARLFDSARDVPRALHESHPYMRWMRARFGSTHWMLAYTPPDASFSFGMSVQPFAGEMFGDRERALFSMLFDHFERAVRLAARPPSLSNDQATIVVGPRGEVLAMSAAAEAIVAACDALVIRDRLIEPLHPPSRGALSRLIHSALGALGQGSAGGMMALPRASGRRSLIVAVSPMPAPLGSLAGFFPGALVQIADSTAMPPPGLAAALRSAFGLTPAEARLAEALLAADGNLRDVAAVLGVTHGTARAQLARIFEKTGARTQSGLVRHLSAAAAALR